MDNLFMGKRGHEMIESVRQYKEARLLARRKRYVVRRINDMLNNTERYRLVCRDWTENALRERRSQLTSDIERLRVERKEWRKNGQRKS